MLADALRTDPHAFRRLAPIGPVVVELREWSRIAEDLTQEYTALANLVRKQLWRYYPLILKATNDVAHPRLLDLWARLPAPESARRVREDTIAKVLKRLRTRRLDAPALFARLPARPGNHRGGENQRGGDRPHQGRRQTVRTGQSADRLLAIACARRESQTSFNPNQQRCNHDRLAPRGYTTAVIPVDHWWGAPQ